MKRILLSLLMSSMALCTFSQKDNPDCLEKTFKFFTPLDGFYLTAYCKFAEFGSYYFTIDIGGG